MARDAEDAKFCPHCHSPLDSSFAPAVLPPPFFDDARRSIVVNGESRHVTRRVWELLIIFWDRPDRRLSKDVLMDLLYPTGIDVPHEKVLDVMICRLRAALAGTPYAIRNLWAQGYVFTAASHPPTALRSPPGDQQEQHP